MTTAMQFNTSNQTLRQLLGNGLRYRVPVFQRDYSWTTEEWEALWADILAMDAPGGQQGHYMGYLVLQTVDNKEFEVIDGQQRLTTLTLLFLASIQHLETLASAGVEPDANRQRAAALRSTYICSLDPVTLVTQSKLRLNRTNERYFQTYIVPFERPPSRGQGPSNRNLSRGYTWLSERLGEHLAERSGAEVAQFVSNLADRLFFTVITVADELNAFTVFETLNARGVRLSSTDLLKNYLFALVHGAGADDTKLAALEGHWQAIVDALGDEEFPNFLRIWWNGRHRPLVRQNDLFRAVRSSVRTERDVFELLRALERSAGVFVALSRPEDPLWTKEQRVGLQLLKMFNVRQPWMLLLVAHEKLSQQEFADVVRHCAVSSFRYNVISKLNPQEQERVYHEQANLLTGDTGDFLGGFRAALARLGPTDSQFEAAFADAELRTTSSRNKQVARYICAELEPELFGPRLDPHDGGYTLAHILPERADPSHWPGIDKDAVDTWCYRLGNYTLLESTKNQKAAGREWAAKRAIFAQSSVQMTASLAQTYPEAWGPEQIQKRQTYLARSCVKIWRLP